MTALEFKLTLNAPIETVWHTWTDSKDITNWFSPEAYIESRIGGAYELYFDPSNHDHQSTKGCKITEIKPRTSLGFQWKGPDMFQETMNDPTPKTFVQVNFEVDSEKTHVTVHHGGLSSGEKWEEAKTWHISAWEGVLTKLEKYME